LVRIGSNLRDHVLDYSSLGRSWRPSAAAGSILENQHRRRHRGGDSRPPSCFPLLAKANEHVTARQYRDWICVARLQQELSLADRYREGKRAPRAGAI
jgi:hypothetical protein